MAGTKSNKKKNNVPVPKNPGQAKGIQKKKGFREWYWLVAILVLTFIVFFPSIDNALTNWDDPKYLTDNPLIRNLGSANIKRIFSEFYFGNYQPLHILSYAIEYHFYKLNPAGYHATSVVMHLIMTGLVLCFIFLLTENSTVAIISALLFGIHPMHVESVAWAAERKDLLYAIFFVSSLILYIRYIKRDEKLKYLCFAFLFFVLSILSKAMASSLPVVLILLDIYFRRKLNLKMILEKVPFFALAVVLGIISIHAAASTNSITTTNVFSLFERVLFVNFNLLAYVGKLILPLNLSAFYPYPDRVAGSIPFYYYVAPIMVIGLLFLVIRSFKKDKLFFFAAAFFVVCIFLVLQLFPVGPTIMSERYSYVPSISFFLMIGVLIQRLTLKRKSLKAPVYTALAGYSLFLSVAAFQRCDVWKDSLTLWNNVLAQFPHVGMALNNRGFIYGKDMEKMDIALEDFNKSIQYEPDYEDAYANRGIVYVMKGKLDLAIRDFDKALELKPDYFEALVNRGITYAQMNQSDKAIADFTSAISIQKDNAVCYLTRGAAFNQFGKYDEALADFNKAISLNPSYPEAFYYRSSILYQKQQYKDAYEDVKKAASFGFKVPEKYFETVKMAAEKNGPS